MSLFHTGHAGQDPGHRRGHAVGRKEDRGAELLGLPLGSGELSDVPDVLPGMSLAGAGGEEIATSFSYQQLAHILLSLFLLSVVTHTQ